MDFGTQRNGSRGREKYLNLRHNIVCPQPRLNIQDVVSHPYIFESCVAFVHFMSHAIW
jgi:hypothetical protein